MQVLRVMPNPNGIKQSFWRGSALQQLGFNDPMTLMELPAIAGNGVAGTVAMVELTDVREAQQRVRPTSIGVHQAKELRRATALFLL